MCVCLYTVDMYPSKHLGFVVCIPACTGVGIQHTHGQRCGLQVVCGQGCVDEGMYTPSIPQMATEAGGTHPTGKLLVLSKGLFAPGIAIRLRGLLRFFPVERIGIVTREHKAGNFGIFVQLLIDINWKQLNPS